MQISKKNEIVNSSDAEKRNQSKYIFIWPEKNYIGFDEKGKTKP